MKKKKRGFEVAKGFEDKGINLPVRKTAYAAGYDFECADQVLHIHFRKHAYGHASVSDHSYRAHTKPH